MKVLEVVGKRKIHHDQKIKAKEVMRKHRF